MYKNKNQIMKKIIINTLMLLCLGCFFSSCSDDKDKITPGDISDIESIAGPGYIKLQWEMPEDGAIFYTKVKYFDHLEQKEMWRLSSTDTIHIPNTRAKFGEYDFNLQTFSSTGTANPTIHEIKASSGMAPSTEVVTPIQLLADQLSTNAQEPTEGPIANLVDGDTKTFFHTQWSSGSPAKPHWMQVELSKELQVFRFQYAPRGNNSNKPTDFDLFGSLDGEYWELIKNFTLEADKLPVTSTEEYKSPTITAPNPFKYLKFSVNETNTGTVYWTMSEFRIYTVTVIDPEAEAEAEAE